MATVFFLPKKLPWDGGREKSNEFNYLIKAGWGGECGKGYAAWRGVIHPTLQLLEGQSATVLGALGTNGLIPGDMGI